MSKNTIGLLYGQKVYLALPKCACSENVHELSYTKLGAGYVRKYIEDTDSYMVEVVIDGSTNSVVNSYCPCDTYDVAGNNTPKTMKEIAANHIFVLGIDDRMVTVGDEPYTIGDTINVYPESDKYKIIAANSDNTLLLVCDVNGIANSGTMNIGSMLIVDLEDPATFIAPGDGVISIPYTYDDGFIIDDEEPGADDTNEG